MLNRVCGVLVTVIRKRQDVLDAFADEARWLGMPLWGGWGNVVDLIWFAVLALARRGP